MKYVHPKKYAGVCMDSKFQSMRVMNQVEVYCLKCSKFMGKEHDFEECKDYSVKWGRRIVGGVTCSFKDMPVSMFSPEVDCEIEEEQNDNK